MEVRAGIEPAIPSHAKTIFVDDNASEGGDGTSWASAHKYLQDALAVAEYGDEIWVAEGTYHPDQTNNLDIHMSLVGRNEKVYSHGYAFKLVNGVRLLGGYKGNEIKQPPLGKPSKTILSGLISSPRPTHYAPTNDRVLQMKKMTQKTKRQSLFILINCTLKRLKLSSLLRLMMLK